MGNDMGVPASIPNAERCLEAMTFTQKCRQLLSQDSSLELTISRGGLETLVSDSERYAENNRVSVERVLASDKIMLGRFVAQYDEGAEGFFVDADEAQEVALQINTALSHHETLIRLLKQCSEMLWGAPMGSAHWGLAREIDAALASATEGESAVAASETPNLSPQGHSHE